MKSSHTAALCSVPQCVIARQGFCCVTLHLKKELLHETGEQHKCSRRAVVTHCHTNSDTTHPSKTTMLCCLPTGFYTLDCSIYACCAHTCSPVSVQAHTYTLPLSMYTVIWGFICSVALKAEERRAEVQMENTNTPSVCCVYVCICVSVPHYR